MTLAKQVRQALKENGINNRQVSVTKRPSGYDRAVACTIKDITVNKQLVEKIASEFIKVDRCERTYEILAGGNSFVSVDYEYGLVKEIAQDFIPQAEEILETADKYTTYLAENEEFQLLLSMDTRFAYIKEKDAPNRHEGTRLDDYGKPAEALANILVLAKYQYGLEI